MNKYYAKRKLREWQGQMDSLNEVTKAIDRMIEEGLTTGKFKNYEEGRRNWQNFYETESSLRPKIQERINYYAEKLNE